MNAIRRHRFALTLVLIGGLLAPATLIAEDDAPATFASPTDAEDYQWQGEYTGRLALPEGEKACGVQLVAGGDGRFNIVAYPGGLPGEGWTGEERITLDGKRTGSKLVAQTGSTAELRDDELHVRNKDGNPIGRLKKVHRKSRTLGLPPPPHATVLFDGLHADAFEDGQVTDDGLLMQGVMSREKFQDFRLHLEFRTPFMPAARGQARGNSGAYMQGRYEVQILDSFGLEGRDNECGGIYGVKSPDLNMAYPPQAWQT